MPPRPWAVLNAFHAAAECRRQVKKLTNLVKNVKMVKFHDNSWHHHEKYIKISTNMPNMCSLIREIAVQECKKAKILFLSETHAHVLSVKKHFSLSRWTP